MHIKQSVPAQEETAGKTSLTDFKIRVNGYFSYSVEN